MAHLFKQMYECEIDFDALTVEKLIDFVFTEMEKLHRPNKMRFTVDRGHGFETALRPSMMKNAGYTMLRELLICFTMMLCGKVSLKLARFLSILNRQGSIEITSRHYSI